MAPLMERSQHWRAHRTLPEAAGDAPMVRGRIGPNAITRVAEAVSVRHGAPAVRTLFDAATLGAWATCPPEAMVDEDDVARLQAALVRLYGAEEARAVSRDAGARTGDYLLAHRIPRLAQRLLRLLPAALAARVLARAIGRHAWTFAGSGRFSCGPGMPFRFAIEACPLCRRLHADAPACDFYGATFERIFRELVNSRARARETACMAAGAPRCEFEIRW